MRINIAEIPENIFRHMIRLYYYHNEHLVGMKQWRNDFLKANGFIFIFDNNGEIKQVEIEEEDYTIFLLKYS